MSEPVPWIVGRDDGGCYVENAEPAAPGGVSLGEAVFASEIEAVRYAVMCEIDTIEPLKANLRTLKARLRKLERAAK